MALASALSAVTKTVPAPAAEGGAKRCKFPFVSFKAEFPRKERVYCIVQLSSQAARRVNSTNGSRARLNRSRIYPAWRRSSGARAGRLRSLGCPPAAHSGRPERQRGKASQRERPRLRHVTGGKLLIGGRVVSPALHCDRRAVCIRGTVRIGDRAAQLDPAVARSRAGVELEQRVLIGKTAVAASVMERGGARQRPFALVDQEVRRPRPSGAPNRAGAKELQVVKHATGKPEIARSVGTDSAAKRGAARHPFYLERN